MLTRREIEKPVDLDIQCWLLTACCALYPDEYSAYPELRVLRRAIEEKHRPLIAVSLEVVCSHLASDLSPRQLELTRRLAEEVRNGTATPIRRTVMALTRASLNQQRHALAS